MIVPPYRLLALDVDGTLLRTDKSLSPRTRQSLDAARAAGVRVLLVTGRRYPAARRVAAALGGEVDLVLHNGALIMEREQVLRCLPLRRETAILAILAGRERGADPVLHVGHQGEGRLLVEGIEPSNTLLVYYLEKSHPDVVVVPDLETALSEDPIQVMFGGGLADMNVLETHLTARLGPAAVVERTAYPAQKVGVLDVLAPGVGKDRAVAFLQARWGVSRQETLAIGDNWNDRAMLEQAGLGLVMGNADPGLRGLGLPVLPSNDEDGVAWAIERHLLRLA